MLPFRQYLDEAWARVNKHEYDVETLQRWYNENENKIVLTSRFRKHQSKVTSNPKAYHAFLYLVKLIVDKEMNFNNPKIRNHSAVGLGFPQASGRIKYRFHKAKHLYHAHLQRGVTDNGDPISLAWKYLTGGRVEFSLVSHEEYNDYIKENS